uniref:Uncharacterized protein n=1 Tax=Musca domestica TaxID=7370 RepID=A0A1I8NK52_MUSDO
MSSGRMSSSSTFHANINNTEIATTIVPDTNYNNYNHNYYYFYNTTTSAGATAAAGTQFVATHKISIAKTTTATTSECVPKILQMHTDATTSSSSSPSSLPPPPSSSSSVATLVPGVSLTNAQQTYGGIGGTGG